MAITTKGSSGSINGTGGAGNVIIAIAALNAPLNSTIIIDVAYIHTDGGGDAQVEKTTFRTGGMGAVINLSVRDAAVGTTITWTALAITIS